MRHFRQLLVASVATYLLVAVPVIGGDMSHSEENKYTKAEWELIEREPWLEIANLSLKPGGVVTLFIVFVGVYFVMRARTLTKQDELITKTNKNYDKIVVLRNKISSLNMI